jgi:hypothetical protein
MCFVILETFVSCETIVNCGCYMCIVAYETILDAGFHVVIMYMRCYM